MKLERYFDPKRFYQATVDVLMQHEVQNIIPLGNVIIGNHARETSGWRNPADWYMATVLDESGEILLVALMTPPFPITLYERNNEPNDGALDLLSRSLIEDGHIVPGVNAHNDLARRFATQYTEKKGQFAEVKTELRLYSMNQLAPDTPKIGSLVQATPDDLYYLPYWYLQFSIDCNLRAVTLDEAWEAVDGAIRKGVLYILEDKGKPVSMASMQREIVNGRCIGMVYTPPFFRRQGYAASCVAAVSQLVLDQGYEYVSLYADLQNPISNSIYQKIGYQFVADCLELSFTNP